MTEIIVSFCVWKWKILAEEDGQVIVNEMGGIKGDLGVWYLSQSL